MKTIRIVENNIEKETSNKPIIKLKLDRKISSSEVDAIILKKQGELLNHDNQ